MTDKEFNEIFGWAFERGKQEMVNSFKSARYMAMEIVVRYNLHNGNKNLKSWDEFTKQDFKRILSKEDIEIIQEAYETYQYAEYCAYLIKDTKSLNIINQELSSFVNLFNDIIVIKESPIEQSKRESEKNRRRNQFTPKDDTLEDIENMDDYERLEYIEDVFIQYDLFRCEINYDDLTVTVRPVDEDAQRVFTAYKGGPFYGFFLSDENEDYISVDIDFIDGEVDDDMFQDLLLFPNGDEVTINNIKSYAEYLYNELMYNGDYDPNEIDNIDFDDD